MKGRNVTTRTRLLGLAVVCAPPAARAAEPAAPPNLVRDGQTIRLSNAPTHFGPVSVEVRSSVDSGRIEAGIQPPLRNPCRAIKLRLRHPESRPIRSVTVDGQPWSDVDRAGEWILLPPRTGPYRVVVSY